MDEESTTQNSSETTDSKNIDNLHKELDDVVSMLDTDVIKALDIKQAKKELEEKVRQLKNQEVELKDVIGHLRETRDKLQTELQTKEGEERNLQDKIDQLKSNKAGLESEKLSLTEQIKNLGLEKSEMNKSLVKTNDLLLRLKQEIAQFDEEIRR